MTVPALTINKVCLSGLGAIALADQLISAGEYDVVVAGGMESMTNAPHLLAGARKGYKYGNGTLLDSMAHDGLFCAFDQVAMGESTERYNAKLGISREEQDAFAARSHERAALAQKNGTFDDELVPVPVPQRKGDPLLVTTDEGVRGDTTVDVLAKLRPAFAPDGTITAGSASQISDGAAAVVVMSRAKAEELGAPILAEIGDAEPAVIVPSLEKAGRSRPSTSTDVSARTPSSALYSSGSPLRWGIETETTSSSKTPSFHALAASSCERAAKASCSSRLNAYSPVFA